MASPEALKSSPRGEIVSIFSTLSDKDLYKQCREIGSKAKYWSRKFEGLIAEIAKRKLYKKHEFKDIFEFCAKIGGMKNDTVREVLRVYRNLEDTPRLRELLENGKVGWSKMRVISSIANREMETFWAQKVVELPKNALEVLAREFRKTGDSGSFPSDNNQALSNPTGSDRDSLDAVDRSQMSTSELSENNYASESNSKQSTVDKSESGVSLKGTEEDSPFQCGTVDNLDCGLKEGGRDRNETERSISDNINQAELPELKRANVKILVDPLIEKRLLDLQEMLSKERGETMDMNQVLETLLSEFRTTEKNVPKYEEVILQCPTCESKVIKTVRGEIPVEEKDLETRQAKGEPIDLEAEKQKVREELEKTKVSRYIPASVRKLVELEFGGFCAFPGCNKRAEVLHHTRRFALAPNHDPFHVIPLCRAHETLAHAGLIENEEEHPSKWKVQMKENIDSPKGRIDAIVMEFRRPDRQMEENVNNGRQKDCLNLGT